MRLLRVRRRQAAAKPSIPRAVYLPGPETNRAGSARSAPEQTAAKSSDFLSPEERQDTEQPVPPPHVAPAPLDDLTAGPQPPLGPAAPVHDSGTPDVTTKRSDTSQLHDFTRAHDTTQMHDTTLIHDTTRIHDSSRLHHAALRRTRLQDATGVHDTTRVHDTTQVHDTSKVHDTTLVHRIVSLRHTARSSQQQGGQSPAANDVRQVGAAPAAIETTPKPETGTPSSGKLTPQRSEGPARRRDGRAARCPGRKAGHQESHGQPYDNQLHVQPGTRGHAATRRPGRPITSRSAALEDDQLDADAARDRAVRVPLDVLLAPYRASEQPDDGDGQPDHGECTVSQRTSSCMCSPGTRRCASSRMPGTAGDWQPRRRTVQRSRPRRALALVPRRC